MYFVPHHTPFQSPTRLSPLNLGPLTPVPAFPVTLGRRDTGVPSVECGPVLFNVKHSSAEIMLEVTIDCDVTCLLRASNLPSVRRSLRMKAGEPRIFDVTGLCPDTSYEIVFESHGYEGTLTTARLKTELHPNAFHQLNIVLINDDIGLLRPGDINPWREVRSMSKSKHLTTLIHIGDNTGITREGSFNLKRSLINRYKESWCANIKSNLVACHSNIVIAPEEHSDLGLESYTGLRRNVSYIGDYGPLCVFYLDHSNVSELGKTLQTKRGVIIVSNIPVLSWDPHLAVMVLQTVFYSIDRFNTEVVLVSGARAACCTEITDPSTGSLVRSLCTGSMTGIPGSPPKFSPPGNYQLSTLSDSWEGQRTVLAISMSLEGKEVSSSVEVHAADVS